MARNMVLQEAIRSWSEERVIMAPKPDSENVYIADAELRPRPVLDKAQWQQWMELNERGLRTLVPVTDMITVGIKWSGVEMALDPNGIPACWSVAFFVGGNSNTSHMFATADIRRFEEKLIAVVTALAEPTDTGMFAWWRRMKLQKRVKAIRKRFAQLRGD